MATPTYSTQKVRQRLEVAIERAIALLDRLDGDPDFEPIDEREPEPGDYCGWQDDGDQTSLRMVIA